MRPGTAVIALVLAVWLGPAWAGDFALPDPHLTPGVVVPGMTKEKVCGTKWSLDRRHVTPAMKREVCRLYGLVCPVVSKTSGSLTGPTEARTVSRMDAGVLWGEWMAARAMSPRGFLSNEPVASQHIDPMGHRFQMGGVDTGGDPTLVIEFRPVRYRPDEILVRKNMGSQLSEPPVAPAHHSVPDPDPAAAHRLALDASLKGAGEAGWSNGPISKSSLGPIAQTHCSGSSSICEHGIEIDHLIPRELGGADDVRNLWPQPWLEARVKDRVENYLHRAVCAGTFSLGIAQATMRTDWRTVLPQATRPR